MQLTDAFCYILLTVTMTATCIEAEGKSQELEDRKADRRLIRREATVLIDSMPAIDRAVLKPKVIYRRISKQNYGHKPKYGPPRSKYGAPKPSRKPNKKYRGKISPKYGPPGQKKHAPKKRYGPPKRTASKPVYGPPKNKPLFMANSYNNGYRSEPMGFGEPPSYEDHHSTKPDYDDFQKPGFEEYQKPVHGDFPKPTNNYFKTGSNDFYKPNLSDFKKPKFNDFQKVNFDGFQKPGFNDFPPIIGYGEPPVDSYGAPIKSSLHDLTYSTAQSFPDTSSHFDKDAFSTMQSWNSYQQDQNIDSKYAFSKKNPVFSKQENDVFVTPVPEDEDEELGLNSYSDIYNFRQMKNSIKKKPFQNLKIIRKPWMGMKPVVEDEIIVGGQYAEPPARYVPNAPIFPENSDFGPPGDNMSDPELVASATNSPYVNYKNSNMAFSPQNLNDAFSIVDK